MTHSYSTPQAKSFEVSLQNHLLSGSNPTLSGAKNEVFSSDGEAYLDWEI